jgi:hypothetical protein
LIRDAKTFGGQMGFEFLAGSVVAHERKCRFTQGRCQEV